MSDVPDLDYYPDDEPPQAWKDLATQAGVARGYVVFRNEEGDVQEVLDGTLLSEGDGKFYWQPNDTGDE